MYPVNLASVIKVEVNSSVTGIMLPKSEDIVKSEATQQEIIKSNAPTFTDIAEPY